MRYRWLGVVSLMVGLAAPPVLAQHQAEAQTFKPKGWEQPEAVGLLQTEHRVLAEGLSLARARRAPRRQVDPEALHERQLQQYGEGARFFGKPMRVDGLDGDEGAVAERDAKPAEPTRSGEPQGSTLLALIGSALAALGLGAFLFMRFRASP